MSSKVTSSLPVQEAVMLTSTPLVLAINGLNVSYYEIKILFIVQYIFDYIAQFICLICLIDLNRLYDVQSLRSDGRLFHSAGAATLNALSP